MLEQKMTYIEAEGERYPMICTMNVLEYIQGEYGTIQRWQVLTSGIVEEEKGKKKTPINVAAMMDVLTVMMNEGVDVYNMNLSKKKEEREYMMHIERKHVGIILRAAGISMVDAAVMALDEVTNGILGKNVETAQSKMVKKEKKRPLTLRGFFMWPFTTSICRRKKQGTCSSGNT